MLSPKALKWNKPLYCIEKRIQEHNEELGHDYKEVTQNMWEEANIIRKYAVNYNATQYTSLIRKFTCEACFPKILNQDQD